ncbi:uncharacterized protein TrAtP1_006065 [Trichoderma atroviride]|uniref:uncharacterized protein n=1 Tax=Hypocrea atroviridis TaxID=63577 RepID=UPI00331E52AC|nr:hypothetical protein TrAtP1_006065 [Trichoderma atroviride]
MYIHVVSPTARIFHFQAEAGGCAMPANALHTNRDSTLHPKCILPIHPRCRRCFTAVAMPSSLPRRSRPKLPRPSPCTPTSLSVLAARHHEAAKLELLPQVTCWLLLLLVSPPLLRPLSPLSLSHAARSLFAIPSMLRSRLAAPAPPPPPRLPLWGRRGRSPLPKPTPLGWTAV